jgi:hypothetical protein
VQTVFECLVGSEIWQLGFVGYVHETMGQQKRWATWMAEAKEANGEPIHGQNTCKSRARCAGAYCTKAKQQKDESARGLMHVGSSCMAGGSKSRTEGIGASRTSCKASLVEAQKRRAQGLKGSRMARKAVKTWRHTHD